jgi:hypothetical protein
MSIQKTLLLTQLETKVEAHLHEAIAIFQNLSDTTLLAPSIGGGWSVAQCLDHLNSYGRYYLPQIEKKMGAKLDVNAESFTSTWLGNYFTRIMDPQTGKKKFKAFKNHRPAKELDAHKVVAEFIEQQETMLRYLVHARHCDLNNVRVPLSIFKLITFKLGDAFQFIIAHNERHVLQAKRNLDK